MPRILQINTCITQSTGRITQQIGERAIDNGWDSFIAFPAHEPMTESRSHLIHIGNKADQYFHALMTRIFDCCGFLSRCATKRLIKQIEEIKPEVIQLHNIHGYYINIPVLFEFLERSRIPVVWTLHDCWAFTGYCTYFTLDCCDRWKKGCSHCPQRKQYSWFFDRSRMLYERKKQLFSGLNLTIITPSQWLADLVKQSFLKEYPVKVIHNGIDLSVFRPTPSDFRERYHIPEDKFVLLGVAFGWGKRKGLDVFVELSRRLDPEKYQIVLVGTDDAVDKNLPENILSIHRTQNQQELAEVYTAADLFVNPTREDNYPTVNMEAIACGTPVVTFDTGGSPESVDEGTGVVVDCDDVDALEQKIIRISHISPFDTDNCIRKAKSFDGAARFEEYLNLLVKT